MIFYIVTILILLALSAFFSAAETSLTTSSRAAMHQRAKEGNRRAKTVMKLKNDSESVISAILLGNNLLNILATAITTAFLAKFSEDGVLYATIVMTFAILIFSEVLPKALALHHASPVALAIAPIVRAWLWITWPAIWTIRLIIRALGATPSFPTTLAEEELRGAIDLHGENRGGTKVNTERTMLQSILDLDDVTVDQVMRHRNSVFMLNVALPTEDILRQVIKSPYTRVPLWQDNPGNIVGILHTKTLLQSLDGGMSFQDLPITSLMSLPWFIPENANLLQQLQEFKRKREHIAIVVDEYGTFLGIITLEDILEEIVGDIADELDTPNRGWRKAGDNVYLIQGSMTLRDLNRDLGWNLPEDDAATLAGLLMHESRTLPQAGQKFRFYGQTFEIVRRKGNQITLIRAGDAAGREEATD
jgi:Mg2+/Co2+ transporter CorB